MTNVRRFGAALAVLMMGWLVVPVGGVPSATAEALTEEDGLFLAQLQDAIAKDDRSWIADQVRYPLSVTIGGERRLLQREEEFLAHYEEIINQRVRDAVQRQTPAGLFVNWQGTMIGDGEVWFYHRLEGSYRCRDVRPPSRGVNLDCTAPDPARRWSPPRTGIIAINNVWHMP